MTVLVNASASSIMTCSCGSTSLLPEALDKALAVAIRFTETLLIQYVYSNLKQSLRILCGN